MSDSPNKAGKTCLEFFAGIGLMRLGLERAGWRTVFANDIDAGKRTMYLDQFPDSGDKFVLDDIHDLASEEIPAATLATASFPCNDLSLAGARHGLSGKNSSAFWGFVDVLDAMGGRRPPVVLLENVSGFLSSHKGRDFFDALTALNTLNYSVDALMIDASFFVPQSRTRLFIIGVEKSQRLTPADCYSSPFQIQEHDVRPQTLIHFMQTHAQLDWRIRKAANLPGRSARLAACIDADGDLQNGWWPQHRAEHLFSQMQPRHAERVQRMRCQNEWSYATAFRRVRNGKTVVEVRADDIAGCLRTPRGGSARQILIKAGFGRQLARLLSARECARLMGADDFPITVSQSRALFGFGDAVVVPVITWLAENYLNPLIDNA